MAILKINPTRINLLRLKQRIKTAKRGHKLLKDKRNGLMKKFMEIISETKSLREELEKKIGKVFSEFLRARSVLDLGQIENAILGSTAKISLQVKTKNVMSVLIPEFSAEFSGNMLNFSKIGTVSALESAVERLQEVFPLLLKIAGLEKAAENLAIEIEKTRRRVNALEYRMIPDLRETLRFIFMKLEESARDALVSVMRIKSMIEEKESLK